VCHPEYSPPGKILLHKAKNNIHYHQRGNRNHRAGDGKILPQKRLLRGFTNYQEKNEIKAGHLQQRATPGHFKYHHEEQINSQRTKDHIHISLLRVNKLPDVNSGSLLTRMTEFHLPALDGVVKSNTEKLSVFFRL
jgi:hypothetical protein